jgi:hypothetical protein
VKSVLSLIGFAALLVAAFVGGNFTRDSAVRAVAAPEDRVAEARATSQDLILHARLDEQRIAYEMYELQMNAYGRKHGLRARIEREAEDLRHPERLPWHKFETRVEFMNRDGRAVAYTSGLAEGWRGDNRGIQGKRKTVGARLGPQPIRKQATS